MTDEGRIERERIGNVLENGSFTYIPGEDNDTVWNGNSAFGADKKHRLKDGCL